MPTSGSEKVPEISEEAVEALWSALRSDAAVTLDEAAAALNAAYPAIRQSVLSEVKEGLLGEEAVEAAIRAGTGESSEQYRKRVLAIDRAEESDHTRAEIEAALATITPEEEK